MRWFSGAALLSVILLGGMANLSAADFTFLPTTGTGNWSLTSNWDTGTVPDVADANIILQAGTGSPQANLAGVTRTIGHISANVSTASWNIQTGGFRWDTTSGAPTITLHNTLANQNLTIQPSMYDPTGGSDGALEIFTDVAGGVVSFTGNNSQFTGGFHLKSSYQASLSLLYSESMGTNTVTLSNANHNLRLGQGAVSRTFSGNIVIGSGASEVTLYSNAAAGGVAILEGVVSGAGNVNYRTYSGGELDLRGINTYTGNSSISSIVMTFSGVENLGTGNKIVFGTNATLIYATGNTDDLTKKGDGTARVVDLTNSNSTVNTNGNDVTFANAVTTTHGTSNFTKSGAGTLRLESGANNFGASLRVSGGTLLVNNASGNGTGGAAIQVGSVLGGTGSVRPGSANSIVIQTGGTLSAGDSLINSGIGNFTINLSSTTGNLTFLDESFLAVDLNTGLAADRIILSSSDVGSVIFAGDTRINLTDQSGGNLTEGAYLLMDAAADNVYSGLTLSGNLITGGLSVNSGVPSGWTSSLRLDSGNIYLDLVPEPTALVLLGLSAGLLALRHRRRC